MAWQTPLVPGRYPGTVPKQIQNREKPKQALGIYREPNSSKQPGLPHCHFRPHQFSYPTVFIFYPTPRSKPATITAPQLDAAECLLIQPFRHRHNCVSMPVSGRDMGFTAATIDGILRLSFATVNINVNINLLLFRFFLYTAFNML